MIFLRSVMKPGNLSLSPRTARGDLAIMSIETFEMLNGKIELYRLLDEGRTAVKEGRKHPLTDVMRDMRQELFDGKILGLHIGTR